MCLFQRSECVKRALLVSCWWSTCRQEREEASATVGVLPVLLLHMWTCPEAKFVDLLRRCREEHIPFLFQEAELLAAVFFFRHGVGDVCVLLGCDVVYFKVDQQ